MGEVWGGPRCGSAHAPFPFKLKKGALVYAEPGSGAWATLTEEAWIGAYAVASSEGWVQVASLPGISVEPGAECEEPAHFWVHARDIV